MPCTIMSTTVNDCTAHELTAPDPYQSCWGDDVGTAFVGDDDEDDAEAEFVGGDEDDDDDDSLGYGDPLDFWLAD